jgi:LPXTG-site transpeptidase (sortase) family protein
MTNQTPSRRLHRPWLLLARNAGAVLLVGGGLLTVAVGGGALIGREKAERSWAESNEASQAARVLAAPAPRWIDEQAATPTALPRAAQARATGLPTPTLAAQATSTPAMNAAVDVRQATPLALPLALTPHSEPGVAPELTSLPGGTTERAESDALPEIGIVGELRAPASAVEIARSEFRFLDPPEPGAQAVISVQLHNEADLPTGPIRLTLSRRWLTGWRVVAADPPVLDDRVRDADRRVFDFPGLNPGSELAFELHLVATDDAVDPPEVRVGLAADESATEARDTTVEIGLAKPETAAPRPRPGPARLIEIPRLGMRAAVVPTVWEPPAFVVGQLRQSANLSEGNTVLIGHLNGLAGNVFAKLDNLEPGDEIVATSRGLAYQFVVSEVMELPEGDSLPVQPTDEPRLTLMTCTGEWDPVTLNYSHRLWVVAEPPEAAELTLSGELPGPLTRQLGLLPPAAPVVSEEPGLPSKAAVVAEPETEAVAELVAPSVAIDAPAEGGTIGSSAMVRGRLLDPGARERPLWLLARAEIEGSRWYPYGAPLTVSPDGTWEASVEIGGSVGVRHTFVVAPVEAATDARLRRHVAQRPGEPLSILPDAFDEGARVTAVRR